MKPFLPLLTVVSLLLLFACRTGRRLPEGQMLYRGAKVKVVADDSSWKLGALKTEAEAAVSVPAPNKSFLGISAGLWVYTHTKDGSWLQRKLGKAPVVFKPDMTRTTEMLLANRAANNGFFDVDIAVKPIENKLKRTVKLRYELRLNAPAVIIDSVAFPPAEGVLEGAIQSTRSATLLKPGDPYNLDNIIQERQRIVKALQNQGYYFLKPDHLLIKADTTLRKGYVNLYLTVKPLTPQRAKVPQMINSVRFVSKTDTSMLVQHAPGDPGDCVSFGPQKGLSVPKDLLLKTMCLRCGRPYNADEHDATLAYLSHLGTYKFINANFIPSQEADSLTDVRVVLTPFSRNKTRINLSAVFSPKLYWGAEFKGYVDRKNAFGRAELLRWDFSGQALRLPKQDADAYDLNLFPIETSLTLTIPRFRPPRFRKGKFYAPLVQSKFSLGYEMNRFVILPKDFVEQKLGTTLHEFTFEGGLVLKNSRRPTVTNAFNLVEIGARFTTIQPPTFRNIFEALIQSDTGQQFINFAPELTIGPNYTLTVDNRFDLKRKRNVYYRGYLQLRGGGFLPSELTSPSLPNFNLVGFVENDFRHFFKTSSKNSVDFKIIANTGLPFSEGSAGTFNINDLYIVGGANSVRAFPPRYFGPGSLPPSASGGDILIVSDHAGNIMLEGSVENRYRFLPRWEFASFIDLGNTWTLEELEEMPGGSFEFNRFYKEFAVGAGFGLRYVYSYLIIRLDIAMPLRKPWLPDGDRWVLDDIAFGSKSWRQENLLFNFAVGYPF